MPAELVTRRGRLRGETRAPREPSRALALARALHALPAEILMVSCEPEEMDELSTELSQTVQAGVDHALIRCWYRRPLPLPLTQDLVWGDIERCREADDLVDGEPS